jgi:transglutaminase-like putative cysteine protease
MRLTIRHETSYRYTAHAHYSIQHLRLTPREEPHQHVLNWNIAAPGRLARFVDAYGNVAHTMVLSEPHEAIRLVVTGTLEIDPARQGRVEAGPGAGLSPLVFTVPTALTDPGSAVREFAARHFRGAGRSAHFLGLAEAIRDAVEYQSGVTQVTSRAEDALALGRGVCQDHAHIFIACCRSLGVPARYVSGYIDPGDTAHAASHAWADVWLPEDGWLGIDITNSQYTSERHCRLAIGRDYLSAAPVRGVRTGGGEETLEVSVAVRSSPVGSANQ